MLSEDIMELRASSDPSNFIDQNVKFDSDLENNAIDNESRKICYDTIFTMEDIESQNEDYKCSNTMTASSDNDPIAQPPLKSNGSAELSSVSHVSVKDLGGEQKIVETNAGGQKHQPECNTKDSSVRVLYNSLPSRSKRKLEELLHHWSEWHAKNFASVEDHVGSLESGEETYFPALHVGSDKTSTVSFSMDVNVRKRQCIGPISSDNDCSPLYDRGYAVGLASGEGVTEKRAVDLREAPRCFNCGSYNHSLSDCSKPRDNNAVNSARKQFQNKKGQNSGPRIPTRYYQESPGGKFDGLKPGVLSAETRKVLGIGELDPPPWLNRMRELGYPPGYLDTEEEDQPSGIAIFGDGDSDNAKSNKKLPVDAQKSQRKMTVDFPGINAPIPENADKWLWSAPTPIDPPHPDSSWTQTDYRHNHFRDPMRPNYHTPSPHFGFGSSPRSPHYPHHYYRSEPFSARGIPIPPSPSYWSPSDPGIPLLHFNYGSF